MKVLASHLNTLLNEAKHKAKITKIYFGYLNNNETDIRTLIFQIIRSFNIIGETTFLSKKEESGITILKFSVFGEVPDGYILTKNIQKSCMKNISGINIKYLPVCRKSENAVINHIVNRSYV